MKLFILIIFTIWAHIIDDYYLQGILASMKQKQWWKENAPQKIYKYDYIIALLEHAFSWAVAVNIPGLVMIYFTKTELSNYNVKNIIFVFIIHWLVHAFIDNVKANMKQINLIVDQLLHMAQIYLIVIVYWSMITF